MASPDTPQKGFEANAMLIHTPEFNGGVGMGRSDGFDLCGQFFEKPPGLLCLLWHVRDEELVCDSPLVASLPILAASQVVAMRRGIVS